MNGELLHAGMTTGGRLRRMGSERGVRARRTVHLGSPSATTGSCLLQSKLKTQTDDDLLLALVLYIPSTRPAVQSEMTSIASVCMAPRPAPCEYFTN